MIFCCCNQAAEGCSDTCARWRGTSGPDHVVCVPSWKKYQPSVEAAIRYAESLKWDKEEE